VVVDSSALAAILFKEPDGAGFARALIRAPSLLMSAATYVEISVVTTMRLGPAGLVPMDRIISRMGIELVPLSAEQARAARDAFAAFGKGRHPAGLNFGDCFAYALARESGRALLFKGGDFRLTDVRPALA
jgi:ribonuclease VapC